MNCSSNKKTCPLKKLLFSVIDTKLARFLKINSFLHKLAPKYGYCKNNLEFKKIINSLKLNAHNFSPMEKDLIFNVLKFHHEIVEDIMIPRSDVVAVNGKVSLDELNDVIVKNAHTRVLVYKDTLDKIIGFIHTKDLFKVITEKQPFELQKLVRKAIITTHSTKLSELLVEMQKKHIHIAAVVDEYGGTDGIVTIEDIMEEIVGRIDDEHDSNECEEYKVISENTILCNARVEVEAIESILNLKLKNEEDEFDTIGGLVLAKVGTVPLPGTIVNISDDIDIEVTEASPRVLKQVKIKLKNAKPLLTKNTA